MNQLSAPLVPLAPQVRFEIRPGVVVEGRPFQQGNEVVVIGQMIAHDLGPIQGMFKMSFETYIRGLQKAQEQLDRMREQGRLSALTHSRVTGMVQGFVPRRLGR